MLVVVDCLFPSCDTEGKTWNDCGVRGMSFYIEILLGVFFFLEIEVQSLSYDR